MSVQHGGSGTSTATLTPQRPSFQHLMESPAQPRLARIGSRIVLALAVLCIAAAGALFAFRQKYDDRIYPGVSVAGMDVGGLSRDEARGTLQNRAAEIEGQRAYLDALDRHWGPTLRELGVTVDVEGTLEQAFAVGREDEGKTRVGSALETLREDTELPLSVEISLERLEAWAAGVDEELGIRPHNAELVIAEGVVTILPESNGTVVDVAGLQNILAKSLVSLQSPTSALPLVDELPTTYATDLEPARQQIEAALSKSVTLKFQSKTWEVTPAQYGDFVAVAIDPEMSGPESVSVDVDNRALARWLADLLGSTINLDPKNAKVAWSGTKLVATAPGEDGRRLLPSSLAESTTGSFFADHSQVEIPIQVLEPEVNGGNLDQLGITTKLASGSSNFDGSDDARSTNIQVGVELLNGTLVPPGGEFSFNHSIGVISPELGFVEAQVIDGERIGRDFGGGICQVSTTVYRAALYAGLPITEWWHHRYRLGFYELDGWTPGLDASILQPEGDPFGGGDFKFMNPSKDSWLLVESYVDWPRAFVVIYGPDFGYTVEVSDPVYGAEIPPSPDLEVVDYDLPAGTVKQSEWPMTGMEVTYYRSVYGPSGDIVLSDEYYIYFSPRGNVYKVSPDMQGYSPAG